MRKTKIHETVSDEEHRYTMTHGQRHLHHISSFKHNHTCPDDQPQMITISIGYNCRTKHWKQFGQCAIRFWTPVRWRNGFGAKAKTLAQKIMPPWGPECGGKCWGVHKLTHTFLKRKIRVPPHLSRSPNFRNWWLVVSNTHSKRIHDYFHCWACYWFFPFHCLFIWL